MENDKEYLHELYKTFYRPKITEFKGKLLSSKSVKKYFNSQGKKLGDTTIDFLEGKVKQLFDYIIEKHKQDKVIRY